MKHILILLLLCYFTFTGNIQAQNAVIDSLETKLSNNKERDTVRVNLLNHLAFLHYRYDKAKASLFIKESNFIADSLDFTRGLGQSIFLMGITSSYQLKHKEAFAHFEEALKLYEIVNFKAGISQCYNNMGMINANQGDQLQAISYFKKSIKIDEEIDNKSAISSALNNIGSVHARLGNYTEAIDSYQQAVIINIEENAALKTASGYNNIGAIYKMQGNYPLALEYHNKSLAIKVQKNDQIGISSSLSNIGNIYHNLKNYDKALDLYEKALKIKIEIGEEIKTAHLLINLGVVYYELKNNKLAREYYSDALKISRETNDKYGVALILVNVGVIHLEENEPDMAYQYFIDAEKINKEMENQLGLYNTYLGLARVFQYKKEYNTALSYVLKSDQLAKKLGGIEEQKEVSNYASEIYGSLGKYKKALEKHKSYKIFNDSLFNKKNIEKISQLEAEYKYKQQLDSASIRELKLTKTVNDTSQDLEKSERNYLWAIIGILLISILLGGIIFYLKLRNVKSKTQNIVIEQKLLRSQMTPHFIFNSLSVLQGMILNNEEKKSVSYLSKFSKLLRIILENSRDKTVSLSQELSAIENYLGLQNLETKAFNYSVLVDKEIDTSLFEVPPMLIQPFVENAIEHAFINQKENKKIDIHLRYLINQLICTITDNGIGVNHDLEPKRETKTSLATTITSERLKILSKDLKMNGTLTIEDRQKYNEQGTIVTLVIPHKKRVA